MTTETTARAPFAPEAAVVINFGGAIGAKQGRVVADEGGETIEVRYLVKAGEKFKTVKAELVSPALDETVVDEPAIDDVPVVDINDQGVSDAEAEAIMVDNADAEAKALLDAETTPTDEQPADEEPRLTVDEVRSFAKEAVIVLGPQAVLAADAAIILTACQGGDLSPADQARVHAESRYQAGRVLIYLDRPAPAGHGEGRERRAAGTRKK